MKNKQNIIGMRGEAAVCLQKGTWGGNGNGDVNTVNTKQIQPKKQPAELLCWDSGKCRRKTKVGQRLLSAITYTKKFMSIFM